MLEGEIKIKIPKRVQEIFGKKWDGKYCEKHPNVKLYWMHDSRSGGNRWMCGECELNKEKAIALSTLRANCHRNQNALADYYAEKKRKSSFNRSE